MMLGEPKMLGEDKTWFRYIVKGLQGEASFATMPAPKEIQLQVFQ
jgi:hypothetical protein